MFWRNLGQRLYTGETSVPVVAHRRIWFALFALVVIFTIGMVAIKGLNFSIDFRGGVDFQAPVAQSEQPAPDRVEDVRAAVRETGLLGSSEPVVTALGDTEMGVQTPPLGQAEEATVQRAIAEVVGAQPDEVTFTSVGPTWGEQITQKGIISLVVFVTLVMAVIWLYFREWRMSVAAIIALMQDIVLTVGLYALIGFEVTPATIIGLLTILGYSLYDTVVVFDRVRENTNGLAATNRSTYSDAANLAVNQTLLRSINTSVVALLPVAGILFVGAGLLGAGTLKDLSLVLFIGIAGGTFSSIFLATPILCVLKEREPAMKSLRTRVERRQRSGRIDPSTANGSSDNGSGDPADPHADAGPNEQVSAGVAAGPLAPSPAAGRIQPQRPPRSRRTKGRRG